MNAAALEFLFVEYEFKRLFAYHFPFRHDSFLKCDPIIWKVGSLFIMIERVHGDRKNNET